MNYELFGVYKLECLKVILDIFVRQYRQKLCEKHPICSRRTKIEASWGALPPTYLLGLLKEG
jgi:hypothetical protein